MINSSSCFRFRARSWWICAAMATVFVMMLAVDLRSESAAASSQTQVVCLTQWEPPVGEYSSKPHSCDFDRRGVLPISHASVEVTKRLHWLHWGSRTATAQGKLGISTAGWAPTKVRLTQPKSICGHSVFTQASFDVRERSNGHTLRFRESLPLADCLR